MNKKKIIYIVSGLSLIGLSAYLFWKIKNSRLPVNGSNAVDQKSDKQIPPGKASTNTFSTGTTFSTGKKEIPADDVLKSGPDAIVNKTIVAKSDGAGIYDTVLSKVGTTKKGETLGKAFKANPLSGGTYNIKYQDSKGQYRIINSISVNVLA